MELKDKLAKIASYTLIGAAALPIVSCREKVEEKKMNILFIMCDDHSYQTISAYDNRYISSQASTATLMVLPTTPAVSTAHSRHSPNCCRRADTRQP